MKLFILTCLASLLAVSSVFAADTTKEKGAPAAPPAKVEDVPGLPRVLIIGDSISDGYTADVRELLKGRANVHRIPANGGPTTKGLEFLPAWLGKTRWDVIHFNWGLHDLKYIGDKPGVAVNVTKPGAHLQVPLAEYEKNLTTLVDQLKATGAKLVWCSTTPVPEGAGPGGRITGDEVKYNEAAARVMSAEGVPTDDLYTHAHARIAEIQRPKDVHYTPEGYKYLAEKVAAEIEKALPKK